MKILVTGSQGFLGKNLVHALSREDGIEILTLDLGDKLSDLDCEGLDFVFHLAGVNRPKNDSEFKTGNTDLTAEVLSYFKNNNIKAPIFYTSSTQADRDNAYGSSKLGAENILVDYSKETKIPVLIYRLPNLFGKWGKPNYNSAVITFCHNIANDLPIQVNDRSYELTLCYVDDVVSAFMGQIGKVLDIKKTHYSVRTQYNVSLGEIADSLYAFKDSRENLLMPEVGDGFLRALYATYLTYLPIDNFAYDLKAFSDDRGSFYEILKFDKCGQFSVSTTKPGITRGNHFHETKNEKFIVVKGKAIIRFKHMLTGELKEYHVDGSKPQVVEMIPGYSHNISNVGEIEMVLLLWANEVFDRDNQDTFFSEI